MDESKFGDVFGKLLNLTDVEIDNMSIQEMFDHRFELIRLQELGLKLLDEIEARHAWKNIPHKNTKKPVVPHEDWLFELINLSSSTYFFTVKYNQN